jgi:hypothetical protein
MADGRLIWWTSVNEGFSESIECIIPFEKKIFIKKGYFGKFSMLLLNCVYLVVIRKTERGRESVPQTIIL